MLEVVSTGLLVVVLAAAGGAALYLAFRLMKGQG